MNMRVILSLCVTAAFIESALSVVVVLPKIWYRNVQAPLSVCSTNEYEILTDSLIEELDYTLDLEGYVQFTDRFDDSDDRKLFRSHSNERSLSWGSCRNICQRSWYLCNWVCPSHKWRRVLDSDDSDDEGGSSDDEGGSSLQSSLEFLLKNLCEEVIAREAVAFSTSCRVALLGASCYSSVEFEDDDD